jgi:plasmid stability protein
MADLFIRNTDKKAPENLKERVAKNNHSQQEE